jgi:predicted metalloendopeptidase
VTDDLARKRVFLTDGRKVAKSSDDTYQEIEAKWDGRSLVSDEKTSRGKFSRTFELAPNGQQLYETIRIDASAYGAARSAPQVYIQYVYDADQGEAR